MYSIGDFIVQMAALHSAHPAADTPRRAFWPVRIA
jgi:hypothetical protein